MENWYLELWLREEDPVSRYLASTTLRTCTFDSCLWHNTTDVLYVYHTYILLIE